MIIVIYCIYSFPCSYLTGLSSGAMHIKIMNNHTHTHTHLDVIVYRLAIRKGEEWKRKWRVGREGERANTR